MRHLVSILGTYAGPGAGTLAATSYIIKAVSRPAAKLLRAPEPALRYPAVALACVTMCSAITLVVSL
jgi:hypothetical protein